MLEKLGCLDGVAQINASHLNAKLIEETGVYRMVRWEVQPRGGFFLPVANLCVSVCEHLES